MPAPSQLVIAMGSVTRLSKEKTTYRKELADAEAQLVKLEEDLRSGAPDPDGNAEFMIKQQRTVIEQTKGVFGPLQTRTENAIAKLADMIEMEERAGPRSPEELDKAKALLETATAEVRKP